MLGLKNRVGLTQFTLALGSRAVDAPSGFVEPFDMMAKAWPRALIRVIIQKLDPSRLNDSTVPLPKIATSTGDDTNHAES